MKTKIVEAVSTDGLYLKAAVSAFDQADWERPAITTSKYRERRTSLLQHEGWTPRHFIIQDLSPPRGGTIFCMGGIAHTDMRNAPAMF